MRIIVPDEDYQKRTRCIVQEDERELDGADYAQRTTEKDPGTDRQSQYCDTGSTSFPAG